MTNFEKIKAMSVEEMAEWIDETIATRCDACPAEKICTIEQSCVGTIIKWLEKGAEEKAIEAWNRRVENGTSRNNA